MNPLRTYIVVIHNAGCEPFVGYAYKGMRDDIFQVRGGTIEEAAQAVLDSPWEPLDAEFTLVELRGGGNVQRFRIAQTRRAVAV